MSRPTVATVRLEAVQSNYRAIRSFVERDTPDNRPVPPGVIAVVKANAYGHGSVPVGLALEAAGASMLSCADLEEGLELRQAGIGVPILVFGALSVSDLAAVFEADLTPTVSTPAAAQALEREAASRGRPVNCHLKVDTGMNRLGFRHDNLVRTMPDVLSSPHLRIRAVYTHFATANEPASEFLDEQRRRFDRAWTDLRTLGLAAVPRHAAGSAALLRDGRTWYEAVRPGLLLYGIVPPPLAEADLDLRPTLSLTRRIVAVKGVRIGEGAGYGLRWTTTEPRTVAIVPAGYADGLDTRLSGRGHVLVRGRRAPIVGAVSMDMLTIDVSGLEVAPGDDVVLIGRQDAEEITARQMAAAVGTIPWEIVCRLGSRVGRTYVSGQS